MEEGTQNNNKKDLDHCISMSVSMPIEVRSAVLPKTEKNSKWSNFESKVEKIFNLAVEKKHQFKGN